MKHDFKNNFNNSETPNNEDLFYNPKVERKKTINFILITWICLIWFAGLINNSSIEEFLGLEALYYEEYNLFGQIEYLFGYNFLWLIPLIIVVVNIIAIKKSSNKNLTIKNQDSEKDSKKFNDLIKLKELLDKNILTQEEFEKEKEKILNK